ncbi:MAG: hypothetical protein C4575_05305 [Desulforudis sp.]|nr:MAG: hypothetical protein C4575_05305 [Desulforudis sp.]
MDGFTHKLVLVFFTACGVLLGAALLGSLGAALVREPPISVMLFPSPDYNRRPTGQPRIDSSAHNSSRGRNIWTRNTGRTYPGAHSQA